MGGPGGEASTGTGPRFSRRTLLSRAALAVGLGGVGSLTLPETVDSSVPARADSRGVDPDAESVSEAETPYAVWQYESEDGEMRPTAPINVVFPLESATFAAVTATCRRSGLTDRPLEYVRYARDRNTGRYRRQQWTAAESFGGVAGRFHVRCWELAGTASVQAHVDTAPLPTHGTASYALARRALERIFDAAGWTVSDDRLHLGNDSGPDHDGYATVIRR